MNNVGRIASKNWLSLVLIFLFTFSVSLVGARFVRSILVGNSNNSVAETQEADETEQADISSRTPEAIKLQGIVNTWIAEVDGRVGVVVYDLDRNEVAASYDPDEVFSVGDSYQLALAYDGYRRLDTGIEKAEANVGYEINYGDCLELMVRGQHQSCAELFLADDNHAASLTEFLAELGMATTSDYGRTSTANDLAKLLQHAWKHEDLSLLSWAKLQDSMFEQPIAAGETDWRQGLPSGFSTAKVYSKASGELDEAGNWINYSDLALVDFVKAGRKFAVVVLGEGISDPSDFGRLGTLIEGKVLEGQQ